MDFPSSTPQPTSVIRHFAALPLGPMLPGSVITAWKQMSMGARLLYIALIKPLSFNRDNNGKIFLSTRHAAKQLGANKHSISIWFRELEHYGFIVNQDKC
jgi:hypothetical protein